MKKILIVIIVIILVVAFFPKQYSVYPGWFTDYDYEQFEKTKKECLGLSIEPADQPADVGIIAYCFGILK